MPRKKLLNKTTAQAMITKTSRDMNMVLCAQGHINLGTRSVRDKSKFNKSSERRANKVRSW